MLYDLSFLTNNQFPPQSEVGRLKKYEKQRKQYLGKHNKGKRLKIKTPELGFKTYDYDVLSLNYYRLLSDKFLSLMMLDKPYVKTDDETISQTLNDLITDGDIWYHFQQVLRNFSTHGDGVMLIHRNQTGQPTISSINPSTWFPIVSQTDVTNIKQHVLITPLPRTQEQQHIKVTKKEEPPINYYIQIHEKGYYDEFVYASNKGKLSSPIDFVLDGRNIPQTGNRVQTRLSDFAVQSIHNSRVNSVYGISDYDIVEPVIDELEKFHTLSHVHTEKTSEPILVVPESYFSINETTGITTFAQAIGGVIGISPDSTAAPQYISTSTNGLSDIQKVIQQLERMLAVLSEYGEQFLFAKQAVSHQSSELLKTAKSTAYDKVSRKIDEFDHVTRYVLSLLLELKGVKIATSEIVVVWNDSKEIGNTEQLKEQIISMRLSNGTITRVQALQEYYGYTQAAAERLVNEIDNEIRKGVLENGEILLESETGKTSGDGGNDTAGNGN